MALQWMILACVVAAEAAMVVLLTLPSPKVIRSRIVSVVSLILHPLFSSYPSPDSSLWWKKEHRLMCTGEVCSASERDRYEKTMYKSQRNAVLCVGACLLYWCTYRICKYYRDIDALEETEKRYKEQ